MSGSRTETNGGGGGSSTPRKSEKPGLSEFASLPLNSRKNKAVAEYVEKLNMMAKEENDKKEKEQLQRRNSFNRLANSPSFGKIPLGRSASSVNSKIPASPSPSPPTTTPSSISATTPSATAASSPLPNTLRRATYSSAPSVVSSTSSSQRSSLTLTSPKSTATTATSPLSGSTSSSSLPQSSTSPIVVHTTSPNISRTIAALTSSPTSSSTSVGSTTSSSNWGQRAAANTVSITSPRQTNTSLGAARSAAATSAPTSVPASPSKGPPKSPPAKASTGPPPRSGSSGGGVTAVAATGGTGAPPSSGSKSNLIVTANAASSATLPMTATFTYKSVSNPTSITVAPAPNDSKISSASLNESSTPTLLTTTPTPSSSALLSPPSPTTNGDASPPSSAKSSPGSSPLPSPHGEGGDVDQMVAKARTAVVMKAPGIATDLPIRNKRNSFNWRALSVRPGSFLILNSTSWENNVEKSLTTADVELGMFGERLDNELKAFESIKETISEAEELLQQIGKQQEQSKTELRIMLVMELMGIRERLEQESQEQSDLLLDWAVNGGEKGRRSTSIEELLMLRFHKGGNGSDTRRSSLPAQ
eukprot:TRINITY_DN16464_c0_g1_i1.p1 TRINITY_DN16464_c0_g1~~TRINITY_DN16464_c0_g1_i1.p1  ORF type:complete len:597 (-),score=174.45 TRINITY_DN16464_c0_g1_i1:66-1832(-)